MAKDRGDAIATVETHSPVDGHAGASDSASPHSAVPPPHSAVPPPHSAVPPPHSRRHDHSLAYFLRSSLAGGISGCVAKSVVAPMDRVKILFQGTRPDYVRHVGSAFGVFRAIRQIVHTQGFAGMFQGHSAMLLRIFPSAAIRFMAYEQYKMLIMPTAETTTPFRTFLAGSLAGNTAVLVTYPFEVIRSRLAYEIRHQSTPVHHHHYHARHHATASSSSSSLNRAYGILPTIRMIIQENEGRGWWRGFYKGFGATMWGIVPYAGVAFMFYEWAKQRILLHDYAAHTKRQTRKDPYTGESYTEEKRVMNVWAHLLVGGVAGSVAQTVSYPFDTIRHRMQLEGVAAGIPKYRGTFHAVRTILAKEGWRGFFVGLSINYWKTMPANAIAFVVYDRMKGVLDIA